MRVRGDSRARARVSTFPFFFSRPLPDLARYVRAYVRVSIRDYASYYGFRVRVAEKKNSRRIPDRIAFHSFRFIRLAYATRLMRTGAASRGELFYARAPKSNLRVVKMRRRSPRGLYRPPRVLAEHGVKSRSRGCGLIRGSRAIAVGKY